MRSSRTILVAAAVCAVVFVLGELFFVPKTYVNSALVQALQAPSALLRAIGSNHNLIQQLSKAQLENQSLRAQLAVAQSRPGIIKEEGATYLRAPVYSVYPLNNVGTLLVAAGSSEGVHEGMTVEAEPGIFVGEVARVYAHASEVRTLYDLGWELPVKVGPQRVDSLLVGGHEPRLTLISKKKSVAADMNVYVAAKRYPYGLLLGVVGDPSDSDKGLFQEAPLMLPYRVGELGAVYVVFTE